MTMRKEIDPGWTWDDRFSYSQAVQVGDWLYISGQVPLDAAGHLAGENDVLAQSRQVFANIDALLQSAGGSRDHIVRITSYLIDMSRYQEYNQARGEYFQGRRPASTTIQVAGLAIPGILVEVDAVAFIA